jgi:hypothetical protein
VRHPCRRYGVRVHSREISTRLLNGQVVIPIGYDDENAINYSVLMGFEPTGADLEFFWVIVGAHTKDGSVVEYWSGLDTKRLFGKPERAAIRSAVMGGVETLLSANRPERIFCCTHDSDAPEKALHKHILIAAVFKTCGYDVVRQPMYLGKHSWWMERKK